MFCARRPLSCVLTSIVSGIVSGRRLFLGHPYTLMTLETLKFDNRVLKSLPVDDDKDNYVRSVEGMFVGSGYCVSVMPST